MNRFLALTTTILGLAACGTSDGDDTGDDAPEAAIEPTSGVWHYTEVTPIGNDCDLSDRYGDNGDFGLVNHGNRTFTVEPNDGGDPFGCTLTGDTAFDCPNRAAATEDFTSQGYDAVLAVRARVAGSFATPGTASGQQTAEVSCVGTDCGLAATVIGTSLPCTFRVDFSVALQQAL